ncbi:21501_t:CDS:2 [Dentiscutata erythropus]|uniref:21501_t:CDS:1 n=1 Tax=Dentiscutata erythropus TaxID=1348616 RepID=A0A9N9BQI5_9GLOM|nr:21501_t:CDS:2 [Dentiscutata erythropus]
MPPLTLYKFIDGRTSTNNLTLIKYEELIQADEEESTVKIWCDKRVKIKKLKDISKCDDSNIKRFEIEVKQFDHPNLLKVFGLTYDENDYCYYLITEIANNGDLRNYLKQKSLSNDPLDWNRKLNLIRQVVDGLKYLHERSIVHTELHPSNIFVHDGIPKITNIGMSKIRTPYNLSFTQYTPPEICNDGVEPFRDNYNVSLAFEIINGTRESSKNGTPREFIHLYEKCWDHNPDRRPNCLEILNELEIVDKREKVNGFRNYETTSELDIRVLEREKGLQKEFIETFGLNKAGNLVGHNFILGTKTILSNLGDLDMFFLKDEPDIFVSGDHTSSFDDNAKLYVPIAYVLYKSDVDNVDEQFILDVNNALNSLDDNEKKEKLNMILNEWGNFVVSEVVIGGAILIKNWSSISDENKSRLMTYIQWGIDYAKGGKSPIFSKVSLNNFPQLETSKKVLKTVGELYDWLKEIYNYRNLEIISYEKFKQSYQLLPNNLIEQFPAIESTNNPSLRMIPQISPTQYEQKKFSEWINVLKNPSKHSLLCDWIHELSLEHGIILKLPYLVSSENACLKFSKEPEITEMNEVILLLEQPQTQQEAYLLDNSIKESNHLKFKDIPFFDHNLAKKPSKKIYCQIIVKLARISFELANIEPIEQVSNMVNISLESCEPYKNLYELFSNHYGHLVPKTLILGAKLSIEHDISQIIINEKRRELNSFDALNIKNILSKWDEKYKLINTKLLMSNGEIIKRDYIEDWLNTLIDNPKNWKIVSYEDWTPMYKISKQTQRKIIDEILSDEYRIVISGKESLQWDDQTYVSIKFPGPVDKNYQIYGRVAKKNIFGIWESIDDVNVGFNHANEYSCSAILHKNKDIRLKYNNLKIFWFVVSKQRGYYTNKYRSIQIAHGKQNISNSQISLDSNNLYTNCILVTSFISQPLKNPPFYEINLKYWTTTTVNMEIIKKQNSGRHGKTSDPYPQETAIQWCIIYTNIDELVNNNKSFPWNVFGITLDESTKK